MQEQEQNALLPLPPPVPWRLPAVVVEQGWGAPPGTQKSWPHGGTTTPSPGSSMVVAAVAVEEEEEEYQGKGATMTATAQPSAGAFR